MGKRLTRIGAAKLPEGLDLLNGHAINAVLQDGNTYFGILQSFTAEQLILEDTRQHKHQLLFSSLYEIVFDSTQPLK